MSVYVYVLSRVIGYWLILRELQAIITYMIVKTLGLKSLNLTVFTSHTKQLTLFGPELKEMCEKIVKRTSWEIDFKIGV